MSPPSPEPPRERSLRGVHGLFPPGSAAGGTQGGCAAAALQPTLQERASATLGRGSGCQVGNVCISHTHLLALTLGLLSRKCRSMLSVAWAQGAVTVMPPRGLSLLSFCCPAQLSPPQCPLARPLGKSCHSWHPLAMGRVLPAWGQGSEQPGQTLTPGPWEGHHPWHVWESWGWDWHGGRQEEKHLPRL